MKIKAFILGLGVLVVSACCLCALRRSMTVDDVLGSNSSAVGISLTASYGAIARRLPDGSYEEIVKRDADPEFVVLLRILSVPGLVHPSPPYGNAEEEWQDIPRQLSRRFRKAVGLAASSDVAIVGRSLRNLLVEAESKINQKIRSAVITYPALPGLNQEQIQDAADYVGVHTIVGPNTPYQPKELYAAYAGHGMGLCKSFRNWTPCRAEGEMMPGQQVLLIELTPLALILHASIIREAKDLGWQAMYSARDYELGDSKSSTPAYGERLAAALISLLQNRYAYAQVPVKIVVIIVGEMADPKAISDVACAAVQQFGSTPVPYVSNPLFLPAIGAAELAWRGQKVDSTSVGCARPRGAAFPNDAHRYAIAKLGNRQGTQSMTDTRLASNQTQHNAGKLRLLDPSVTANSFEDGAHKGVCAHTGIARMTRKHWKEARSKGHEARDVYVIEPARIQKTLAPQCALQCRSRTPDASGIDTACFFAMADPFTTVSAEALSLLQSTKPLLQSYLRIAGTSSPTSPELLSARADLEAALQDLAADLDDLSASVNAAERDPTRFGIDGQELQRRRALIGNISDELKRMEKAARGDVGDGRLPPPGAFDDVEAEEDEDNFPAFEEERQQQLFAEQDVQLEGVGRTIGNLRAQAEDMGRELEEQGEMLDGVDMLADRVSGKLQAGLTRIGWVIKKNEGQLRVECTRQRLWLIIYRLDELLLHWCSDLRSDTAADHGACPMIFRTASVSLNTEAATIYSHS
ncbi:hypothetical protein MRB53_041357 [Persea americana]|nr:hypothetical protein MRB53_041357 [Persea americana]